MRARYQRGGPRHRRGGTGGLKLPQCRPAEAAL
jgi:hypothetical protein